MEFSLTLASIVRIIYSLLVLVLALLSLVGIYIFIKHGQNRTFTITVSLIYASVFIAFVTSSLILSFNFA